MLTNDFPAVTFYPDGSCDSAQIVLASRNSEDARRIEVRLSGILGSVSTRTVSSEDALNNETADVEEEYDELFENSQPVSSSSSESSDDLSF